MENFENNSDRFRDMVQMVREYGGCPVSAALNVFGGKWKPLMLYFISVDVNRFGQLQRMMPGCSKKVMTENLRELEEVGLVSRKVFAELPPRVIYSLTPKGESLRPIFRALSDWGATHVLKAKISTSEATPA